MYCSTIKHFFSDAVLEFPFIIRGIMIIKLILDQVSSKDKIGIFSQYLVFISFPGLLQLLPDPLQQAATVLSEGWGAATSPQTTDQESEDWARRKRMCLWQSWRGSALHVHRYQVIKGMCLNLGLRYFQPFCLQARSLWSTYPCAIVLQPEQSGLSRRSLCQSVGRDWRWPASIASS